MLPTKRHLSFTLTILVHALTMVSTSTCPTPEEKLACIDSLIQLAVDKIPVLVGLGVGVVADGKVVSAKGYGLRNYSDPESHATSKTIYAIGSCTKAFTSFSLDRLRIDGVLDWDDLVTKHIPEFRVKDVCATTNMKIKDLASHLSGLPRNDLVWEGTNFPRDELLVRLPYFEPNYGFRERYQYNNIMYAVAGIVVERASNRSWEDFVRSHIFEKYQMTRSFPQIREAWDKHVDDLSVGHMAQSASSVVSTEWLEITNVAPCGAIVSSAEDMAKWAAVHLQLSGESTEMHEVHAPIPANDPSKSGAIGYGFGWFSGYYQGRKVVFHGGRITGFTAYVTLFPNEKDGIVTLSNSGSRPVLDFIQNLNLKIADILNGCSTSEEEIKNWVEEQAKTAADSQNSLQWNTTSGEKPKVKHPEQYVGSFWNGGYGDFDVFLSGSGLAAFYTYNYTVVATAVPDMFYFNGMVGWFQRNTLGDVVGVSINFEEKVAPIPFVKKIPAEFYAESYLQSFVGDYGDVKIGMEKQKHLLTVTGALSVAQKFSDTELTPVKRNWFSQDHLFFEFVVSSEKVNELVVHSDDSYKSFLKK